MAGDRIKLLQTTISRLKLRNVLRAAGCGDIDGSIQAMSFTPGEALLIWLAEWLAKRRPITDEQQTLLVTEMAGPVVDAASEIDRTLDDTGEQKIKAVQLAIVDASLAFFSGQATYLDLRTGDRQTATRRQAPIETTTINLTALYATRRRQTAARDAPKTATGDSAGR